MRMGYIDLGFVLALIGASVGMFYCISIQVWAKMIWDLFFLIQERELKAKR
jgi:hypothetical protein